MIPRWTVADLITRYSLEPTLRDVFVEGEFDQEIATKAIKQRGITDIVVYPSDCVDVGVSYIEKHSLTLGNKQRLLALSREITLAGIAAKVLFFVDRDLDHHFGDLEASPNLRWSRYCSMEGYLISKRLIQEIVADAGNVKIGDFDTYYQSIVDIVRFLFAFRLADRSLGFNQRLIGFARFVSTDNDSLKLDTVGYVERILMSNSRSKEKDLFLAELEKWRSKLNVDFRLSARGHDLIEIIALSVRLLKGIKGLADSIVVRRIFVLVADRADELVDDVSI